MYQEMFSPISQHSSVELELSDNPCSKDFKLGCEGCKFTNTYWTSVLIKPHYQCWRYILHSLWSPNLCIYWNLWTWCSLSFQRSFDSDVCLMSGGSDTHLNAGFNLDHSRRKGGSGGGSEKPRPAYRAAGPLSTAVLG